MKLYGYRIGSQAEEPLELQEVTLAADPQVLRSLARFALHVAQRMEASGESFGHEHFEDFDHDMKGGPSVVVTRLQQRRRGRRA